jgi:signal transduction histidine kinase
MDENSQELSLLAPGLIHEMRHPLMGILAGLELLQRKLGLEGSAMPELQMVVAQAQRLHEMFRTWEELLNGGTAKTPFLVGDTVKRAVDLMSWRLRRLGDRFALEAPQKPVWAMGVPNAVVHAVTNLLANAIDAVESQPGRVQVRVITDTSGVEVRISDEGCGIPAEVKDRLFTPRFTTKPPGRGTGLGLHIARSMMERSGGKVWLVDEADPGRASWARTEFAVLCAPHEVKP